MATSIKLPPELKTRIDRIAQAQRRSPHWIMIEAIRQYAEREDGRHGSTANESWASFHDRAQDEIVGEDGSHDASTAAADSARAADALRRYAEAKTPYDKFMALAGAGSSFKSKQEIDDYIDWIRER